MNLKQPTQDLPGAWRRLCGWFAEYPFVVVAFSGGVDSTLVLRAAVQEKTAGRVIAVTADSASLARKELNECRELAAKMGVVHVVLATAELDNPAYQANDASRCFHCKTELYSSLGRWLGSPGLESELSSHIPAGAIHVITDGLNADDLQDFRPGRSAADSAGVLHPLVENNLVKSQVRELARFAGLPNWDKPAMACLASRISRGVRVDAARLSQVEEAEEILKRHGYRGARVRFHLLSGTPDEQLARIELQPADLPRFLASEDRSGISADLKSLGFHHVTVDIEGYKRGGSAS